VDTSHLMSIGHYYPSLRGTGHYSLFGPNNLRLICRIHWTLYHPERYPLPFAHLRQIQIMEICKKRPKVGYPKNTKRQKRGGGWKIDFPRPPPSKLQAFKLPMRHISYYQIRDPSIHCPETLRPSNFLLKQRAHSYSTSSLDAPGREPSIFHLTSSDAARKSVPNHL
jgi:hypothetical protein